MLTTTLKEGLQGYAIGAKIRTLRLKKKMGLVELGQHTGLSPALLSKIERGLLFPTLPTLLRVAMVFSVGLEFFFSGPRDAPLVAVVRKVDRLRFPDRVGGRESTYRFESLDFTATERRFNSYLAEFFPAPEAGIIRHDHAGAEFIYVLQGALIVQIGEVECSLAEGDSVYFDSGVSHGYSRRGTRTCRALVVATP